MGLALDCFSMIVTEELAHDLLPDILTLLNSKRAFVRRKAVLCLFRIFKQYPPALEESYDKLVNLLVDSDISVQSSAVSVITELAREDPSRYQNLAPTIFTLLLNVENTWVLIKVIKLLMNLVTEEPRLAKKLLDPLVNVVRTAETKSLLYEAMMGVTQCLIHMPVKVGSTVGAGDSMMASILYDLERGLPWRELAARAVAVSAANVMCSGSQPADPADIAPLIGQVQLEDLD